MKCRIPQIDDGGSRVAVEYAYYFIALEARECTKVQVQQVSSAVFDFRLVVRFACASVGTDRALS